MQTLTGSMDYGPTLKNKNNNKKQPTNQAKTTTSTTTLKTQRDKVVVCVLFAPPPLVSLKGWKWKNVTAEHNGSTLQL